MLNDSDMNPHKAKLYWQTDSRIVGEFLVTCEKLYENIIEVSYSLNIGKQFV